MKNFNLLVSTSRYNETNAKSELWFTLLMCGDTYPIISGIQFPGLITALTDLNPLEVIFKINIILKENPNFFQYILKIVPINFICETDIKTITQVIEENHKEHIGENDSFRITLKRRHHEKIERENFIRTIADIIDNKVDLVNPDKIVRIEILGNICGVSFLKENEIIRIKA
ncbi:MAG: THUMP domain-containing protein [Promethearchaeota archaeon]|nr:MAG: THUMP domain-containing protein [Candidatus Lokiarchaeota archaeon]